MEELGEFPCWDVVPAGECKNQVKEHHKPDLVILPSGIHVDKV